LNLSDNQKKRLVFYYLFILTVLSIVPVNSSAELIPGTDKAAHFVFYFILCALFLYSKVFKKNKNQIIIIIVFSLTFGFFIECIQGFLPWRSFEIKDLAANLAGTISGVCVYFFTIQPRNKLTFKTKKK
jgi:VanZ family protein